LVNTRIKELRRIFKYTQEDLAKVTGISLRTIQNLENKPIKNRNLDSLLKIKKALCCNSIEDLLELEE